MATKSNQSNLAPLLVIVGPTASGKTALAIELANKFNGEIICADSRTIYKGMNIGTAKPTSAEMQGITHHLLDIIEPDKSFNVAEFQKLANQAISEIQKRGKLPILVGGSGLYIDSVIFNYDFASSISPRDEQNPRHLAADAPKQQLKLRSNTLILGTQVDPEMLKERIRLRVETMVEVGLVEEVNQLSEKYGWDNLAMQASAYKSLKPFIDGELTIEEAKAKIVTLDIQLAKKQRTWFKRNNSIQWLDDPRQAVDLVTTFLNNYL